MTISDLANSEPNLLRKWFSDVYILLGKVIENKDLDGTNLRDLAFEIIVTLVESYPKHFKNDKEKLKVFIQSLFKYALEMDMELNDDWTTPKTLSFIEEDVVPEENLQLSLGMVERLCEAIEPKLILENLVVIVQDLLGNSSNDWRFKYTGLMILCTMCDEIDDMAEVKNIFPTVFGNVKNNHPKIRFACMQVIEASIDQFGNVFHQNYHTDLVPVLLEGIKNEKVLRCQLQTCETLNAFIDNCPENILKEHTKNCLDALFPVLLDNNTFVSLKENILNVLSNLVNNLGEEEFKPYAETSLDLLIKAFSLLLKEGKDKSIYGSLLELITTVGPCCEEYYKKYISDIIPAIINLQNSIPYSTDPLFDYLSSAWEKLIPYIKQSFSNAIPSIIECTLKLVSNVPTMKISSQPEQNFNINELLKDDVQDPKIVKQKVQLSTSETQDYAGSLSLLSTIIDAFGEQYELYIENTEKIVLPLLTFDINDDIRVEAANLIPFLLNIIKKKLTKENNINAFHHKCKEYLSQLIHTLEKEEYNGAVCSQLDAIGSLIEKAGLFLQENEIENLFVKLLEIFDKTELSRLDLLKKKQTTIENFETDRKEGNDKINSDDEGNEEDEEAYLEEMKKEVEEIEDILVSIADIMGSMFKTHKENTLNIVKQLVNTLLPKYLRKEATSFEIKMGLYIVDDMIEFLGQSLLSNIWKDLVQICLTYVDDKEPQLRQASVYGIGEFAVNTNEGFSDYSKYIIEGLEKALRYGDDGQSITNWKSARDNAVSALGKIIKYQSKSVDLPNLINTWVSYLPMDQDNIEANKIHKIFVELLINNTDMIIGNDKCNLNKVLRILAKIVDTKFVDDKTNEEIKNLIKSIKSNDQFAPFIRQSINEASKELAEKMMELYK